MLYQIKSHSHRPKEAVITRSQLLVAQFSTFEKVCYPTVGDDELSSVGGNVLSWSFD